MSTIIKLTSSGESFGDNVTKPEPDQLSLYVEVLMFVEVGPSLAYIGELERECRLNYKIILRRNSIQSKIYLKNGSCILKEHKTSSTIWDSS